MLSTTALAGAAKSRASIGSTKKNRTFLSTIEKTRKDVTGHDVFLRPVWLVKVSFCGGTSPFHASIRALSMTRERYSNADDAEALFSKVVSGRIACPKFVRTGAEWSFLSVSSHDRQQSISSPVPEMGLFKLVLLKTRQLLLLKLMG